MLKFRWWSVTLQLTQPGLITQQFYLFVGITVFLSKLLMIGVIMIKIQLNLWKVSAKNNFARCYSIICSKIGFDYRVQSVWFAFIFSYYESIAHRFIYNGLKIWDFENFGGQNPNPCSKSEKRFWCGQHDTFLIFLEFSFRKLSIFSIWRFISLISRKLDITTRSHYRIEIDWFGIDRNNETNWSK